MQVKQYLTQRQVAVQLNVSERTLERWRLEGTGPAFAKAGRRVLYDRELIEAWLQKGTRRSTSEVGGGHA